MDSFPFMAFLAGLLTVLTPCVFIVLPVILTGSVLEQHRFRPLIIVVSLAASILLFTILLKLTAGIFPIPREFWKFFSGFLVLFFGVILLFPHLWEGISFLFRFNKAELLLNYGQKKDSFWGHAFLGASLGPVFSSCSPTYLLILATVLPSDLGKGILYLSLYLMGLSIPLLLIGYGGRSVISRFHFAANPQGYFKKSMGIVLILIGIFILTGIDKRLEALLIEKGYANILLWEEQELKKVEFSE